MKNDGSLFYKNMDPEVTLKRIDIVRQVLKHTGCPLELWVHMATAVMQSMGKLWWRSVHVALLETRALE